jgi:hypothetical protein
MHVSAHHPQAHYDQHGELQSHNKLMYESKMKIN